jgi:hypothetical protein
VVEIFKAVGMFKLMSIFKAGRMFKAAVEVHFPRAQVGIKT